ncbi:FepA family TonB-dependent siderophore receptor [Puniceibacterium sediminis]|uniref:Ferric enterobactin receptor n=1 Tax=Puniceibacterium sediminis TaxID=1608407 RepID=A0A238X7K6_9RHOB|nr:FepA family TonB-dependent siderophore receptor [Puniceibacterium sediminis]SNR54690.1 ferric enterobactin receptor [Puniceibacterium sediminis]
MASPNFAFKSNTALCLSLVLAALAGQGAAQTATPVGEDAFALDTIVISAEDQIKQALGASTITQGDIEKSAVVNDISEIIRKMPGANLTGNSVSGDRGNNRQIDLRGMGPENTLILIDGKPVLARNSVATSRRGERDTRGDTNWVPAELVERIEVIRGPAAARYGSGAAGGVVNIITKKPEKTTGSVSLHYNLPESAQEGSTVRTNFMIAGPVSEKLTFRVFGNYNKSESDSSDINAEAGEEADSDTVYAGREGVVNKDIGAMLTWKPAAGQEIDFELGYSRQGNEYACDAGTGGCSDSLQEYVGEETNIMTRRTYSVTHRGEFQTWNAFSYLQWEHTNNTRNGQGTAGGGDGNINSSDMTTIGYDSITAKTEWDRPLTFAGYDSHLTLGAEYRGELMDNENLDAGNASEQHLFGLYAEANILLTDKLTLTPGMRYDHSGTFGSNWSPSVNATYDITGEWQMKAGVARAFKAPNLFQLNPDYIYSTRGRGCPSGVPGPCRILGNPDLEAEYSVNKEIGVAYKGYNGIAGSLTYYHNDYKNRIAAGIEAVSSDASGSLLQWENTPEAVVSGLEGNFSAPLGDSFALNTNFTYMLDSKDKKTGNPLSLVPEYTINAGIDWQARDALVLTLSATHYGKISAATRTLHTNVDVEDAEDRDPYTLVNLGAKWEFNDTGYLSAGVTNLFDTQINRTDGSSSGANTYNEPGRAFYVALTRNF